MPPAARLAVHGVMIATTPRGPAMPSRRNSFSSAAVARYPLRTNPAIPQGHDDHREEWGSEGDEEVEADGLRESESLTHDPLHDPHGT